MIPYLVMFLISTILIYIWEHSEKKGNLLLIIALLLPCLLAGFRGLTVGTDTDWYPLKIYEAAKNTTHFHDFYNYIVLRNVGMGLLYRVSSFEIGFVILGYICGTFFKSFNLFLFLIEFIIIFPTFWGLKKFELVTKQKMLWFAMLTYYFQIYNVGLNLMRQMMTISMLFYGFSSLINDDKHKILKYIISFIIALTFHNSAILGIIYLIGYLGLKKSSNTKKIIKFGNHTINTKAIIIVMTLAGCILLLSVPYLFKSIGIYLGINSRYINYLGEKFTILGNTIFYLPIVILFLGCRKEFIKEKNAYLLIFIFIIFIFANQMSTSTSNYGARIAYFFQIFNPISIVLILNSYKNVTTRNVFRHLLTIVLAAYWLYFFVYRGYAGTVPYVFQ